VPRRIPRIRFIVLRDWQPHFGSGSGQTLRGTHAGKINGRIFLRKMVPCIEPYTNPF
jgi:hypothetical protein